MKVKELILFLEERKNRIDKESKIKVACDEEWNEVFTDVRIEFDEKGCIVFFGLTGSEEDRGF